MADTLTPWALERIPGTAIVLVVTPPTETDPTRTVAIVQGRSIEEKEERARLLLLARETMAACVETEALLEDLRMGLPGSVIRKKVSFCRLQDSITSILETMRAEGGGE